MKNPLDNIKTLKEGWEYFLTVFGHMIPEEDRIKFEGCFYAGAATYDAVLFKPIRTADQESDAPDGTLVHLNITDNISALHNEVGEYAEKRVNEGEWELKKEQKQQGPNWIYKRN